ncbi:filamentous hemagglutinin N-terminal domain-containing protein [Providencia sp. Me31A]|uniref:filamentous hemagglutinin N-terminal domain-containing protein n=1 Tax=Providencia sp. Me31A TaxID=3392637 RepID=UPI003D2B7720
MQTKKSKALINDEHLNYIAIILFNLTDWFFCLIIATHFTIILLRVLMYKLNKIFLCVSIILGYSSIANANIINTNGAGVQKNPNGSTIVNINKASEKGVSHNVYNVFDVDKNGVILNNSATNSNTTLSGNVAGNSNLSSGSAKVILNEVNSNRASAINGMIEVAGDKAQVIIANPSGITCNSCGFINTERATLTTGRIVNSFNGEISGYNVDRGTIVINGSMKSDSPTDIISRSVSVRGKIEAAKQLTVIAGSNFVDRDNQYTTPIRPAGSSAKYGIDVSSLGGMYSDKITLITTDRGVGVSNNGNISANIDGLSLTTTGPVLNQNGNIKSSGDILIDTNSTVTNYSNIISDGGNITLNTKADLYNLNGNISAKNNV